MENKIELNKNIDLPEIQEMSFTKDLANDIVLPDYCDDINRIIRVDAKPVVKNKYANKDSVKINGIIAVTIIYISEPYKQLKSFTFPNDFEYSFDIQGIKPNQKIIPKMEIGELNCRLLNPRKLSIRIENAIALKLVDNNSTYNNFSSSDDMAEKDNIQIEKLKQNIECCNTLYGETESKIEESVPVTEGPVVNEIICAEVFVEIDDIKPLYNKAVVKFTANVKCLYNSIEDKSDYVIITKKIPSTQIIDVDDLDEKYSCIVKTNLSSLKTDIDIDQYGENKIIDIGFIIQSELIAYKNDQYDLIIDAFSPKYENEVQSEVVKNQKFKGIYKEKQKVEDSVILEDAAADNVIDAAGIIIIDTSTVNDSAVTVNSNAEISVMIKNSDGEIQNLDCTIPIKTDITMNEKVSDGNAEIYCTISDISAKIENGKLCVELYADFECVVFENIVSDVIKSIIIETEKPKKANSDTQMIIYYPTKGENLWSIAKKYDSQVGKIMKYNKCDNYNIADKKIIIIPL